MARGRKTKAEEAVNRTKVVQAENPTKKLTRIEGFPGVYLTPRGTFTAYTVAGKVAGTYSTIEAALEEQAKRNTAIRGGESVGSVKDEKRTLVTFAEETFFPHYAKKVAASTYRAAHARFDQHLKPFFEDRQFRAITKKTVEEFMAELAKKKSARQKPLSAQSQRESLLLLRAILAHAEVKNHAKAVDLPKKAKCRPTVPTLKAATAIIGYITTNPHALIAKTLLYTGMRLGEALGLRWDDVDFTHGRIFVRRTIDHLTGSVNVPKTEGSERIVPLMDELKPLLRQHRKHQNAGSVPKNGDWIFVSSRTRRRHKDGAPVVGHRSFEQDYFAPAAKKAGVPDVTPHAFRHLFATRMLQGHPVVEVSAWLGHTLVSTTLDIYAAYLPDDRPKPQKTMSAAFAPSSRR